MNRLHVLLTSFYLLLAVGYTVRATGISNAQLASTAINSTPSGAVSSPLAKNSPNPSNTSNSFSKSQATCPQARTQAEINQCLGQEAKAADKKLNQLYQQLLGRYKTGNPVREKLIDAESAWIKYRDATCAFSYSRFSGGSIAPSVYSGCIQRVTEQRITDFQNYMQEGNVY